MDKTARSQNNPPSNLESTTENKTPETLKEHSKQQQRQDGGKPSKPNNLMLDQETLARAILTFCIDGADALMYATIKGAGSASTALSLICTAQNGKIRDTQRLDQAFATGTARWGRKVNARGMESFHRSLNRWHMRLSQLPSRDVHTLIDWFTQGGTQWIIGPSSTMWPEQLDDLSTRKDWATPLCLWGYGNPATLVSCPKPIAIVGSRGVDEYGRYVARSVGMHAAQAGHLVVSGGAYGADAAAHWGALESMSQLGPKNSGSTVAVFAGGLNHIGPERNTELFERIENTGGALISELCPDTIPEARRFLLRNRIIAALASTVVVAQARVRSGALNTATWAADLGREVYAAPGDINVPHNTGCNHLISENRAMLLTSVHAIGDICHAPHVPASVKPTESSPQCSPATPTRVLQHGAATPQSSDESTGVEPLESSRSTETTNERQLSVAKAIRQCQKSKILADHDNLLRTINNAPTIGRATKLSNQAPWSMEDLNAALGEMELFGTITEHGGCFELTSPTPATGRKQGQPQPRPVRHSAWNGRKQ